MALILEAVYAVPPAVLVATMDNGGTLCIARFKAPQEY